MDNNKSELYKIEKRYKRLRWVQHILFWLSVISAVIPAFIVTLKVGLRYTESEESWSLAVFSVAIFALGLIFVLRGLLRKFAEKISWALGATVACWVMLLILWSLERIIDDALLIAWALSIGCSVALIMSSISDLCKVQADCLKEEYKEAVKKQEE